MLRIDSTVPGIGLVSPRPGLESVVTQGLSSGLPSPGNSVGDVLNITPSLAALHADKQRMADFAKSVGNLDRLAEKAVGTITKVAATANQIIKLFPPYPDGSEAKTALLAEMNEALASLGKTVNGCSPSKPGIPAFITEAALERIPVLIAYAATIKLGRSLPELATAADRLSETVHALVTARAALKDAVSPQTR